MLIVIIHLMDSIRETTHVIVVAEVEGAQHLEYVSPRKFETKTTVNGLELVENRVIQILEDEVKVLFPTEHLDQAHQIFVSQFLQFNIFQSYFVSLI